MLKIQRLKILFLLVMLFGLSANVLAQPTIYVVRHAEKLAGWPKGKAGAYQPLSEQGIKTADRLAAWFKGKKVSAVYSSSTSRTLHTAFPLSQQAGVKIKIESACSDTSFIDSFLGKLRNEYKPNDIVIIVSHSNIVPYFLLKAGLPDACRDEMGITQIPDSWLLTNFYGALFSFKNTREKTKTCADFMRIPF